MSVEVIREAPEQEFFFGEDIFERFPEMKGCLAERGSFVVRGAIDQSKIFQYRKPVEETHRIYVGRCDAQGVDYKAARLEWAGRQGWEGIAHGLRLGQTQAGSRTVFPVIQCTIW